MFAERYSPIELTLDARPKGQESPIGSYPGIRICRRIMLLGRKVNCGDLPLRFQFFLGLQADVANQLFSTDAAHAAVIQAPAENERVQPTPLLEEGTADSSDASSDFDRLVEANVADTDSQLLLDTDAAVNPTPLIREDLFGSLLLKPELQPVYVCLLSASGDPTNSDRTQLPPHY
ncbi:hypothetical protein T4B_1287 [Trichinella pseudospiralis]|uniref:Uncharacterized protein n=2 Tax=Trichinella pseudospiralis TaxID=6337 RepID=A0A0V1EWM4_TRIPS|nr:hypothetical protein T4A_345 [Trichinella pseudospiralis]KRY92905.1 hypothetical protein T4D_10605 [Trichinella pseudospiralis]KRZ08569.1 hypothetical protein T4B_1287 [Trichinella pseudospiralis]KRZ41525.1 hypothetical protein T4C_11586 [Trichinella pseudospiralis]